MIALLLLLAFVGFLIVLPLLLVGFLIRLAFGLVIIPLKLAGFAVRLTLGFVFGLVGLILLGTVVLIPLLPFLGVAFVVWMLVKLLTRHRAAPVPTVPTLS